MSPIPQLKDSLAATATDLKANLTQLKAATEEAWNSLQEIEKKLLVLINQNDYDVSELFANSAVVGKRRRRRSVSPVNGDSNTTRPGTTATAGPTSPPMQTGGGGGVGGPSSAVSSSSLNMNKGGPGGSGGNLSSSLPPEEMGSKASVGSSSGVEIQPGLYLSMRTNYREQRIREERVYMEVSSF